MTTKPTGEELVRRLDAAYEPTRLPEATGEMFLASAKAKALSLMYWKLGITLGVMLLVIGALLIYAISQSTPGPNEPTFEPSLETDASLSLRQTTNHGAEAGVSLGSLREWILR